MTENKLDTQLSHAPKILHGLKRRAVHPAIQIMAGLELAITILTRQKEGDNL